MWLQGTRFRIAIPKERMNQIINEIEADGKIILFIDELHTIIGSGSGIDEYLGCGKYFETCSSTWNSSYGWSNYSS